MSRYSSSTWFASAAVVLAVLPGSAQADSRIEIGGNLGAHDFASNSELGALNQRNDAPGVEAAGRIGVRVGYALTKRFVVEAEASWMASQDDVLGHSVDVFGGRVQGRFDLLTGKLRPFVLAGYGGLWLASSDKMQLSNDVDQAFHVGIGASYAVSTKWSVRVDLTSLIVPDRTDGGATTDPEVTIGAVWHLGAARKAPVRLAPAPSVAPSVDPDDDGVFTPDDECPAQAEDRDGFADDDGCPDRDNDEDRIADGADKCANDAETRNGYQDDDGCPDQVLNDLTGITFEPNSARFDASAVAMLERAYQVLAGNALLQIEIGGHTSSEGDAAHNQLLSLQRAEAVKAYLIARGIAEPRLHTAGYGAEKPVADNYSEPGRAKNRRIEFRILADIK
jgi:OOP family OmpA-OmpF porin